MNCSSTNASDNNECRDVFTHAIKGIASPERQLRALEAGFFPIRMRVYGVGEIFAFPEFENGELMLSTVEPMGFDKHLFINLMKKAANG